MVRFEALSSAWRACLEEAWQAYIEGSLPIGCVIVDSAGEIRSRGRNRRFEVEGPPQTAVGRLGHAELNAIMAAPGSLDLARSVLYSTAEPCVLCFGAISLVRIPRYYYIVPDPLAASPDLDRYRATRGIEAIQVREPSVDVILRCWLADRWLRIGRAAVLDLERKGHAEAAHALAVRDEGHSPQMLVFVRHHREPLAGLRAKRASVAEAIDALSRAGLGDANQD